MLYVVTEETGEYKPIVEPIASFRVLEEAEKYKKIREYEENIRQEIDTLRREWGDMKSYEIYKVKDHDGTIDLQRELRQIDSTYGEELSNEISRHTALVRQRQLERHSRDDDLIRYQKAVVNEFMEWWDGGPARDAWFEEKKQAKLRFVRNIVEMYLKKTNDEIVIEWMRTNDFLQDWE
jgi:hypothetical protein